MMISQEKETTRRSQDIKAKGGRPKEAGWEKNIKKKKTNKTDGPVKTKTIRIIQLNTNRSRDAHDMVNKMAEDSKSDFLIISEPNKKLLNGGGWYTDQNQDATIKVNNKHVTVESSGSERGHVWVDTENHRIISGYISPNISIEEFKGYVEVLGDSIGDTHKHVILAGDFNAKAKAWGSAVEDHRGTILTEMLAQRDMVVQNRGDRPTFEGGRGVSIVDITCTSQHVANKVVSWKVSENETLSDHNAILFELADSVNEKDDKEKTERWKWDGQRAGDFCREVTKQVAKVDEQNVGEVMGAIKAACKTVLKGKGPGGRKRVYWWTSDIARRREACIKAKRKYTRTKKKQRPEDTRSAYEEYREARKQLRDQIRSEKKASWEKLVEEINDNPWGLGYKIAAGKIVREVPPTASETKEAVRTLFPERPKIAWKARTNRAPIQFTAEEIQSAASRLRSGKAPGPDGVPAEAIKEIIKTEPQQLLVPINKSIEKGEFPKRWKKAKLVLIPKGSGKKPGERKFRPICLLDAAGKLTEHMIKDRLMKELEEKGGLADNQYGFREKRSTLDAIEEVMDIAKMANAGTWGTKEYCALITLDVENAFNSAPWGKIVGALEKLGISDSLIEIIESYLSERSIMVGKEEIVVTCGVPQGSVLGPTLWNILYDEVLRLEMPLGTRLIGFADDLATVAVGKTETELMKVANEALDKIHRWMTNTGLKLATHKTEAVLLVGKRRPGEVIFKLQDQVIRPTRSVKYLGVRIDRGMKFGPHVEEVTEKAEKLTGALGRIMPNLNGAVSSKRKLLSTVIHSRILYGAGAWASRGDEVLNGRNKAQLAKAQRKVLLRVIGGYRTMSTIALQVIAGVAPIDLQIKKAVKIRKNTDKEKAEQDMVKEWQYRWETSENGAWTRRLIEDVEKWVKRKHGEVDYYMAQVLSGHGCFSDYLQWIRKETSDNCWYCDERDDAEHTLFRCERWDLDRLQVMKETGEWPTIENVVEIMLRSEKDWNSVAHYARNIIKAKEEMERTRKRERIQQGGQGRNDSKK